MDKETLYQFAEHYQEMGLPVFPIHDFYKVPLKGSHGALDATLDLEEFKRLVSGFLPKHKIGMGIRTGDPLPGGGFLLVLDIDEKSGKSGSQSLKAVGLEIKHTLAATTRSGGRHYFYRSATQVRTINDFVEGVDIECKGGKIWICPTSGYVWDQDPAESLIADAPDWLRVSSLKTWARKGGKKYGGGTEEISPAEAWALITDEETGEIVGLEDGRRRALDGLMWYLAYREMPMDQAREFAEKLDQLDDSSCWVDRFDNNVERTIQKAEDSRLRKEEEKEAELQKSVDKFVAMFGKKK